MEFDWDNKKNASNFIKHGVWFEEAQTVWADPYAKEFFDQLHSVDEDRFLRVGRCRHHRRLVVVFCVRGDGVIRIVSARKLSFGERKRYEG